MCETLERPAESNLLAISYSGDPDPWLRNWQRVAGERPSEFGFVSVGAKTRSAAAESSPTSNGPTSRHPTSGGRSPPTDGTLPVATAVPDPTDIARVGVRASEYLEAWAGNGCRSVVVLDSLTALVDAVGIERAVHFVHLLSGRVESVDGRGYYLLDPADHDDVALGVLREAVDSVADLDASLPE
jgi:hypothetical protein